MTHSKQDSFAGKITRCAPVEGSNLRRCMGGGGTTCVSGECLVINSGTTASTSELSEGKLAKMFVVSAGLRSVEGGGFEIWKTAGLMATGDSGDIGLSKRLT